MFVRIVNEYDHTIHMKRTIAVRIMSSEIRSTIL